MTASDRAFLVASGFGEAALRALPGDASFRQYARLAGGPCPALLMRTDPADAAAFARLAAALLAAGVRAPAVLASDPATGRLLVEDLGAATLADRLDAGADPVPLYAAAGRTLAALQDAAPTVDLPRWDAAAMVSAASATFLGWWWPAAFGSAPAPAIAAALDTALHDMLAPFAGSGFVHRDYFPPNLIPLPGQATLGLIDFQDAAVGHPAYDLVSLIEDARRDVAPAARAAAIAAYGADRPGAEPAALAALGAHRHLRVAGLWVRLARRDGRPAYLRHGPRTWARLADSLRHPAAAALRHFLACHVPCDMRCNPGPPDDMARTPTQPLGAAHA